MLEKSAIIYEDEWLLVVHKPSAVPVHNSEWGDRSGRSLIQMAASYLGQRVSAVHRLDRPASGLVILAKDRETAANAGRAFQRRTVRKTYVALVRGFCDASGVIGLPLPRHHGSRPKTGPEILLESETAYRSVQKYELPFQSDRYPTSRLTLLAVQPLTGRWHQIRRHLNRVAHPILGDTTHGDNTQNRFFRCQFGLQRLMLASTALEIQHPRTMAPLRLEATPEHSFLQVLEHISEWAVPPVNKTSWHGKTNFDDTSSASGLS